MKSNLSESPSRQVSPETFAKLAEPSNRSRVFYTVDEASERLDCSDKTVYRWLKQGKLRGGRGPGGIRLSRAEVDMMVQLILEGKL